MDVCLPFDAFVLSRIHMYANVNDDVEDGSCFVRAYMRTHTYMYDCTYMGEA